MIRLTQNTQSVETEARTAGQETRRVARSLGRAADAQGAAVTALRAQPVGADAAETAENRSLEPGYPNPLPVAAVLQRLAVAKATEHHRFWPDDVSLTDTAIFKHAELLGPKQVTDRYLLALAVRNDGRFVTFDQGIRPTAVIGASAEPLTAATGSAQCSRAVPA
jgi:hypothetical protein